MRSTTASTCVVIVPASNEALCTKLLQLLVRPGSKLVGCENGLLKMGRIRAKNLFFRNCELSNLDLQEASIEDLTLVDVKLSNIDLRKANLKGLKVAATSPIIASDCQFNGLNSSIIRVLRHGGQLIDYTVDLTKLGSTDSNDADTCVTVGKIENVSFDIQEFSPSHIAFFDDAMHFYDQKTIQGAGKILYQMSEDVLLQLFPVRNEACVLWKTDHFTSVVYLDEHNLKAEHLGAVEESNVCYMGKGRLLFIKDGKLWFLENGKTSPLIEWADQYRCFTATCDAADRLIVLIIHSGGFRKLVFNKELQTEADAEFSGDGYSDGYQQITILNSPGEEEQGKYLALAATDSDSLYLITINEDHVKTKEVQSAVVCSNLMIDSGYGDPDKDELCVKDRAAYDLLSMLKSASRANN